jgi:hypothetical protein
VPAGRAELDACTSAGRVADGAAPGVFVDWGAGGVSYHRARLLNPDKAENRRRSCDFGATDDELLEAAADEDDGACRGCSDLGRSRET